MKVQVFKTKREKELDTWRSMYFFLKKRRDSPCPKKEKWREIAHERSSYTIYTKIHTHAHLDQGLWLVSPSDPVFDLATYEEQVCLQLFPYPELHIKAFLEVGEKEGNTCLGEEFKKQK